MAAKVSPREQLNEEEARSAIVAYLHERVNRDGNEPVIRQILSLCAATPSGKTVGKRLRKAQRLCVVGVVVSGVIFGLTGFGPSIAWLFKASWWMAIGILTVCVVFAGLEIARACIDARHYHRTFAKTLQGGEKFRRTFEKNLEEDQAFRSNIFRTDRYWEEMLDADGFREFASNILLRERTHRQAVIETVFDEGGVEAKQLYDDVVARMKDAAFGQALVGLLKERAAAAAQARQPPPPSAGPKS